MAVLSAALAARMVLILLDLATGPSGMPVGQVVHALTADPQGAIVGACLGLAGLSMQTMLTIPLVLPHTGSSSPRPRCCSRSSSGCSDRC